MKKIYLEQNVLEAALERVRWVFSEFQNVYVSFSGGKDSTVVLNLALQVAEEMGRLPLAVHFTDQEAEWQSVIDYIRTVMNDPRVSPRWLQIPIKLFNATSTEEPWLYCWDPNEEANWMRPKEPNAITRNVYGTDRFKDLFGAFLRYHHPTKPAAALGGVRCEESPGRMLGLTIAETYKGVTWGTADPRRKHFAFYPIYDWSYCNTGEAPVWMGDYSFRRLDTIQPGDDVIGFTVSKGGVKSRLQRTRVTATAARRAPVVKITLESGRQVRCTRDHQWQRLRRHDTGPWQFGAVNVGDAMGHVVDPVNATRSFTSSWLGGIYDGEGSDDCIAQSPKANPAVHAAIVKALADLGLPFTINDGRGSGEPGRQHADDIRLLGGRPTLVTFAQMVRPVKMRGLDRLILSSRFRRRDRVVSIEDDGEDTVYSLQTELGTYVAWGYASKNCDVWKFIHERNLPYCKLYDQQYQYGVPIMNMRVSNVHHETATKSLWYLQELEPETWDKLTRRLRGVNTASQMRGDFFQPKALPPMFKDWWEYRDYLLENLITDPADQAKFRDQFARFDARYSGKDAEALVQTEIGAILVNDTFLTKLETFQASHKTNKRKAALGVAP